MSAIGDALTALATVVGSVSGITTVFKNVPQHGPLPAELPAVFFELKPASTEMLRTRTRAVVWPVDMWILTELRGSDIEDSLPDVYGLPELITAKLDLNAKLNDTLDRTIEYAEPAFSADERAFGPIAMGDNTYVGTVIHAILTITRVGGFSA